MANKIRLTVGGMQYSVISDDNEEYLTALGRELEARLNYLAKKNPFLSTTMVAVLAALESSDSAKKAQSENRQLRAEITDLMEQLAILKSSTRPAGKPNER